MSNRYQELFRLKSRLYLEGCPVVIEAGALQKDNQTNQVLAQVKFRNISSRTIVACKVAIEAYEPNGEKLEGIENYSYLDLNVTAGQEFGTKTPVYLPNNTTRRFTVEVTEIVYIDGTVWASNGISEWKQIPTQDRVLRRLKNQDLIEQYETEIGQDAIFYPERVNGLFLCTCGTVNMENAERCYKCRRKYESLISVLDEDHLRTNSEIRKKREQEENKEDK